MHVLSSLYSFLDSVPAWVTAVTGIVSAASAITALTPTPKDDNFVAGIVKVLDLLALNVGHRKRADRKD